MRVVIYGASSGGMKALKFCETCGIYVEAFIDRDITKKGKSIKGIQIKNLDDEGMVLLKNFVVIMGTDNEQAEKYVSNITKKYIGYNVIREFNNMSSSEIYKEDLFEYEINKEESNNKIALVIGEKTDEAIELIRLLLKKKYHVYCVGISRQNINYEVMLDDNVEYIEVNMTLDKIEFGNCIDIARPNEIYNLISLNENGNKSSISTLDMLQSIKEKELKVKMCVVFRNDVLHLIQRMKDNKNNVTDYERKVILEYWNIKNYRDYLNEFICSCVLFDNEGQYIKNNNILNNIIEDIINVKNKKNDCLYVNNYEFNIGYTQDYINAIWMMLQQYNADDYVISANENRSLKDVIEIAFSYLGIDIEWSVSDNKNIGINKQNNQIIVRVENNNAKTVNNRNIIVDNRKAIYQLRWKRSMSFEDILEKTIDKKLDELNLKEQMKNEKSIINYGTNLKSCICTQKQLESEKFNKIRKELKQDVSNFYRKDWEFAYIIKALDENKFLQQGKKGIGFAVGTEPLPAYFASKGCEILATDLAISNSNAKLWAETGQNTEGDVCALNKENLCDEKIFNERVKYMDLDMNNIPKDLKEFDFCWSACAIEHIGSLEKSKKFLKKMLDVLKPGGIAVHTTEYNLSSEINTIEEGSNILFRRIDIEEIIEWLKANGHSVEVDFTRGRKFGDIFVDQYPYKVIDPKCHLALNIGGFTSTSFGFIIKKAIN